MSEGEKDTQAIVINPAVEELFKAGVQFGYARTRRHPRMRDFIAGMKSNVEIFHLEKVDELLTIALDFIENLGKEGATIIWVGTKPAAADCIQEIGETLEHPYVNHRWLGGTITNFDNIRKRITHWQNLLEQQRTGELEKYTKQERLMIQKEIDRLSRAFGGLVRYTAIPRAFFIVDAKEESNAFHEASLKQIPVVALINSDCDPLGVTYPIPGNDNAPESIRLILEKAKAAYLKGKHNAGN